MNHSIKKIIALVMLAVVFCMTGCSAAEKEAQTALTNILEALKSGKADKSTNITALTELRLTWTKRTAKSSARRFCRPYPR